MRLEQLKIENFRGFESLTLDFHPEVTVLVGANGSGKTTVLEAVVLVLANTLEPPPLERTHFFSPTDYRSGTEGATIILGVEHEDHHTDLEYRLVIDRDSTGRIRDRGTEARLGFPEFDFQQEVWWSPGPIPIACYYDVERHTHDSTPRSRDPIFRKPIDAWNDAWNARAGFHEFFQWFRELEDMENADRLNDPEFRDRQLAAARRAIESLLPGCSHPHVYRARQSEPVGINRPVLTVEKAGQILAFDQLSHGERLLVALAGDIARRLAIANPESEDPLLGEGVVLIDEPDLHLHPEWQAKVIPALRRTFPNVQLVVTTHSLIVLSYVPSECVRLLEGFQLVEPPAPTEGREPNALASEVYGVPLRPPEVEAELHRIAVLIDAERFAEARAGLEALSEKLGDTDTGIVGLQTALALEDI